MSYRIRPEANIYTFDLILYSKLTHYLQNTYVQVSASSGSKFFYVEVTKVTTDFQISGDGVVKSGTWNTHPELIVQVKVVCTDTIGY